MKIIDLLNKIANGEEVPKKIYFCLRNFEFSRYKQDYICRDNDEPGIYGMSICKWLFPSMLNNEVQILDESKEDKIEKLEKSTDYSAENDIKEIFDRVKELIDVVNKQNKCIEEFKKLKEELEK